MNLLKPNGLTLTRPDQPRWIPTPALRKAGWAACALKRTDGIYMSAGAALDAAHEINKLVDDWKNDLPITGRPWAHLAPRQPRTLPPKSNTIGALIDAFYASDHFKNLKLATQRDYKNRLNRLRETLSGHVRGHPKNLDLPIDDKRRAIAKYEKNIGLVNQTPISELCSDPQILPTAYQNLRGLINQTSGQPCTHNANSILAYTQSWLQWVIDNHKEAAHWLPYNPAKNVKRKASPGRVVIWSNDELEQIIKMANNTGFKSIGYAVELALELSWSQIDILNLTWGQVKNGRIMGTRSKTQNKTYTTLTKNGQDIINRLLDDYRAANGDNIAPAPSTPIITVDKIAGRTNKGAIGGAWKSDYFRHKFIELREMCHPPIEKTFQDLRDTAITRMKEAGLNDHQIQSRSQHSLAQIRNILDKHYGMTTLDISDSAAELLNSKRPFLRDNV